MDSRYTTQLDEMTTEFPHLLFYLTPVATDHRFTVGIDDQQISTIFTGQLFTDFLSGSIDDS